MKSLGFGLDSVVLPPPYSQIASVMLILGICYAAKAIAKFGIMKQHYPLNFVISVLISISLISTVLYFALLFMTLPLILLKVIAIAYIIIGSVFSYRLVLWLFFARKRILSSLHGLRAIELLLLLGYFLIACGPMSNADSLDYHLGVPLQILEKGTFPVNVEWFHGRLAGAGEALNALGLAIGAEQFPALIQFSGLLAIYVIIKSYPSDSVHAIKYKNLAALLYLSSPLLIFLVSTAKPQLFPAALSVAAFALVFSFSYPKSDFSRQTMFLNSFIVIFFTATAYNNKLSFLLTFALLNGVLGFLLFKHRMLFFWQYMLLAIAAIFMVSVPTIWKMRHYDAHILEAIVRPLPGIYPGNEGFSQFLTNYLENSLQFPLNLLIPDKLGTITTVIGTGCLLFLGFDRARSDWRKMNIYLLAISGFLLFGYCYGQRTSRFFLEPYLWIILLGIVLFTINDSSRLNWMKYKIFLSAGLIQAFLVLLMIGFGVSQNGWAYFSEPARDEVMNKTAYGYDIMKWADGILPKDAVLVSDFRPVALAPRKFIAMDWQGYLKKSTPDAQIYASWIKKRLPTHLLKLNPKNEEIYADCLGNLLGNHKSFVATRNPTNRGDTMHAYIYEFDHRKLPLCMRFPKNQ